MLGEPTIHKDTDKKPLQSTIPLFMNWGTTQYF